MERPYSIKNIVGRTCGDLTVINLFRTDGRYYVGIRCNNCGVVRSMAVKNFSVTRGICQYCRKESQLYYV
jgi:uncharacterized Zn finger protein